MRDITGKIGSIGLDTSLVLLFLAVEMGRAGNFASLETVFMSITMLMVLVLPYFLPSAELSEPSLAKWLVFRSAMASFGLAFGLILPASMGFLPMNLLILAGICSCFVQFYGLMRLRLAD